MRVISAAYGDERELSVDALDGTAAIGSLNLHLETFPPWGRVNQAYHGSIHCGNYQRDTLSLSALSSDAWTRGSPPERHLGALIRISCGEWSMTQSVRMPVLKSSSQEQEITGIRATDAKVVVCGRRFSAEVCTKRNPQHGIDRIHSASRRHQSFNR